MKQLSIIFALFLAVGLFSCGNPKDLVYQDVKHFRINKISLTPEIGLDVQFYNPNKYGMTLKDANIDLYINDKLVGKAFLPEKYSAPGLDTFLLPVVLAADLKNVIPNAIALVGNKEVTIRLAGSVKAGKGVFVNIPINYAGKQKLNVF